MSGCRSGREVLHSVDSAWIMDNILELKRKAAPWVKEDVPAIMAHLRWLKAVHESEPGMTILVTHDDGLFDRSHGVGRHRRTTKIIRSRKIKGGIPWRRVPLP